MEPRPPHRRLIGIAACVAAIVLLGAALVVGKLVYSAPVVRLASYDGTGRH